jgi:hypothetical protein
MMAKHNKKRNVGIIYEQLLKKASHEMVENDNMSSSEVLGILKENFKPGTQLYKEFRLFNALVKTTVDSESLAIRILGEAKAAARDHDETQLRAEKSKLIKDINHKLNDPDFYSQRVDEYKDYATVQTLLNDWRRGNSSDLSRIAEYENRTVKMLTTKKEAESLKENHDSSVNHLTVKIMTEKFNKKYGTLLNEHQREIINKYVFSLVDDDTSSFVKYVENLKEQSIIDLDAYSKTCDNRVLNEKMDKVRKNIRDLDVNNVNDETIARLLTVAALKDQLSGDEK